MLNYYPIYVVRKYYKELNIMVFMGKISSMNTLPDGRIKIKVCVEEQEALCLKGCTTNVHVFSDALCTIESKVIERGKGGVTKHFLIPKKIRDKRKIQAGETRCQRIDSGSKAVFVYVVPYPGENGRKKEILSSPSFSGNWC